MTAALRARVQAAIAELRQLRCDDPAAEPGLHAARATAYTLELWWLPALDELATDPPGSGHAGRFHAVDDDAPEQPGESIVLG